jgi:hypothetical protein
MKKIIASAVGLVLVGGVAVTTASAVESQFGGYWRTRMYFDKNFVNDDSARNTTDTRTRLFYTAKFNDDLKFVNSFEFNTSWGDNNGGDIAGDGKGNWRIRESYVDATFGKVNAKVGIQAALISRGFVYADVLSGAVVEADFGMVKVPVLYGALSTEDVNNGLSWDGAKAASVAFSISDAVVPGFGNGNGDVHLLSIFPQIKVNDSVMITPHATWATVTSQDTDIYWLGVDADMKFDAVSAWATAIYNGGKIDAINGPIAGVATGAGNKDISAYLLAAGADVNLGSAGVHGQAFYGSGDDTPNDSDIDAFVEISGPGSGGGYYWAEILGNGVFDNPMQYADGTGFQTDKITNQWAANLGVTIKPMAKMKLDFDAWYARLAQDRLSYNGNMENELGLELDGKLTYALMDDLKAELVYAYLFAGDAIGPDDVMEGGVRLTLSF